jgi:hypothetical protein
VENYAFNKEALMAAPRHRRNDNGTWDSICLGCFQTIARAKSETELREQEFEHVCFPLQFSQEADRYSPRIMVRLVGKST